MFSESGEVVPHSAWANFNLVSEDNNIGYIICGHCQTSFDDRNVRTMLEHMEARHPDVYIEDLREVVESEGPPVKRIKLEVVDSDTAVASNNNNYVPQSTENAVKKVSLTRFSNPDTSKQTLDDSTATSSSKAETISIKCGNSSSVEDSSIEHESLSFVEKAVSDKWRLMGRYPDKSAMNEARRKNRVSSQYSNRFHGFMRRYYRCTDAGCKYRMMSIGETEFSLFATEHHMEDLQQENGQERNVSETAITTPLKSRSSCSLPNQSLSTLSLHSNPPPVPNAASSDMVKPGPLPANQHAQLMKIAKDQGLEFNVDDVATGVFRFQKEAQFLCFRIKEVIIDIEYCESQGRLIADCFPVTSWGQFLTAIRMKCLRVFES